MKDEAKGGKFETNTNDKNFQNQNKFRAAAFLF